MALESLQVGKIHLLAPVTTQDPFSKACFPQALIGVNPLEGISAGLLFPAQCSQHSAGINFLISSTRCWTNGFHSLRIPLIQYRATCESVKHCGSSKLKQAFKLPVTLVISLAKRTAGSSSNLGIVWTLRGDTWVFDTINLEYLLSPFLQPGN